jgi:hypothetical protein
MRTIWKDFVEFSCGITGWKEKEAQMYIRFYFYVANSDIIYIYLCLYLLK